MLWLEGPIWVWEISMTFHYSLPLKKGGRNVFCQYFHCDGPRLCWMLLCTVVPDQISTPHCTPGGLVCWPPDQLLSQRWSCASIDLPWIYLGPMLCSTCTLSLRERLLSPPTHLRWTLPHLSASNFLWLDGGWFVQPPLPLLAFKGLKRAKLNLK